ncbi:TBC1 domain family member 23-like [Oppia nitens]|uniref:TBC1 domain family member 23-like n=1 Tax=Oppia nitens TaxID=1686743 RepID=UPI0023DAAA22|nr:TBC1 domain family member 23-like [Oppia nitens]
MDDQLVTDSSDVDVDVDDDNDNILDIDINGTSDEDSGWIMELETALLADCDPKIIKKITNQKLVPNHMRYELWQVLLGIKGRHKILSDIFDLPEQPLIRTDCQQLVGKLANTDDTERMAICSDIETIVTNFAKLNDMDYRTENGWLEVLEPLLTLKLKREDLFKVFESIQLKFIPKYYNCRLNSSCNNNNNNNNSNDNSSQQSFSFLRLLLQYHEPELCSYLDTLKITPDLYANTWFRSLLSSHCTHSVTLALWDTYFSLGNPFLIYFLSLVMLVNEKDTIMSMPIDNKPAIIDYLSSVPKGLCMEDIGDMFYLVQQHYVSRTPPTIKNLQSLLFQASEPLEDNESQIDDLSHMLCLPVPISDLMPNTTNTTVTAGGADNNNTTVNSVRYFCVDCRPADQYNNGHLSTAFHLDCSLLLEEPSAFNTAVKGLLAAQRQSIEEQSVAGGQHLCFIGSGRDEEDQYVHMVVASFLQKHHQYVSLAYGGYQRLHELLCLMNSNNGSNIDRYLIDHNRKQCIACISSRQQLAGDKQSPINNKNRRLIGGGQRRSLSPTTGTAITADVEHFTRVLFDKVANAVKPKMKEMKNKFVDYVTNPQQQQQHQQQQQQQQQRQQMVRHVSPTDKLGKRYKSFNRFTIDESDGLDTDSNDDEESSSSQLQQEIDIEKWSKSPDIIGCFKCQEIKDDGYMCASYLALSHTHLYVLRELSHNKRLVKIMAKRPLEMIVQITSKRRCPDLITFKYGHTVEGGGEPNVVAKDHLLIPKPYDVTRLIKQQVVKILDDIGGNGSGSGGSGGGGSGGGGGGESSSGSTTSSTTNKTTTLK